MRCAETPQGRLVFQGRARASWSRAFFRSASARAAGIRNTPPWKETASLAFEKRELSVSGSRTLEQKARLTVSLRHGSSRTTRGGRESGYLCQFWLRRIARRHAMRFGPRPPPERCAAVRRSALPQESVFRSFPARRGAHRGGPGGFFGKPAAGGSKKSSSRGT